MDNSSDPKRSPEVTAVRNRIVHGDHWLSARRRELKMSQETLAARLQIEGLNYARGTIAHWETGDANPPLFDPDFRRGLANALELTPAQLLALAGYEVLDHPRSGVALRAADILEQLPLRWQVFLMLHLENLLKLYQEERLSDDPGNPVETQKE